MEPWLDRVSAAAETRVGSTGAAFVSVTKPCGLVGQITGADGEAVAAAVCLTAVRACRGVRGRPLLGAVTFLNDVPCFITGFLSVGFGGTSRVCVI